MSNLQINEVFFSPQGEGEYAGVPTLFVRLFRCNLDCSWCDQPNALSTRPRQVVYELSAEEIADTITHYPITVPVCFTGGEPTLQHVELVELIKLIREGDEEVQSAAWISKMNAGPNAVPMNSRRLLTIETNGTIFEQKLAAECFLSISPKTTQVTLDGKAQMHGERELRMWIRSGAKLQLKFVVEDERHFNAIVGWLDTFVEPHFRSSIPVYFQPEWFKGRENFTALIKTMMKPEKWEPLAALGFPIRFMPQMHKAMAVR